MIKVGKLLNESAVTVINWDEFTTKLSLSKTGKNIYLERLEMLVKSSSTFHVCITNKEFVLGIRGKTLSFYRDPTNSIEFGESDISKIEYAEVSGGCYFSIFMKNNLICRIVV
jgi:hypothetical protein